MKKYSLLLLIAILILGASLRFYRFPQIETYPGDAKRDLFAARDIILYRQYPLLGPPTSLGWLYLSPAVYFLWAAILFIGRLNFSFAAVFTSFLDTAAIYFIYRLGKTAFGEKEALLSALFYSSSPYLINHSRIPLHVNLMPLFVILFYLFLMDYLLYDKRKYYFLSWVVLGILFQLHATAIILLFILLFFSYRKKCWRILDIGLAIFIAVISPWWIADIVSNDFLTIGKFAAWIPYRIGSAAGFITTKNMITIGRLKEAAETAIITLGNIIFPLQKYIALMIFAVCAIKRNLGFINAILVIFFISLFLHGQPNEQYFICIAPIIILMLGNFFSKNIATVFIALLIVTFNIIFLLHYGYLLSQYQENHEFTHG
jgi:4-amino-4-deoxy-L-arabinose transferase-like glycosyltransferase